MNSKQTEEPACNLSNAELIDRVEKWVHKLAETGGQAWTLRVPVDFNHDPDMLIIEVCKRFSASLPSKPVGDVEEMDRVIKFLALELPEPVWNDVNKKWQRFKSGYAAAQQSGDGWVSVEDAPNAKQYVLCYGSGGRQFAALYDNNTFMAYNPFNDELEECEEVTHWQPLPAPPSTE